jgi:hypothetical protein
MERTAEMSHNRTSDRPCLVDSVEGNAVNLAGSWSFFWPEQFNPPPLVGDTVELENIRWTQFVGAKVNGEWRFRYTDEEIDEQDRQWREKFEQDKRDRLAASRAEWIGHEENLPLWGKQRLARFRQAGGEAFELDGWGYELAICRLAAAYVDEGVPEKGDYTLTPAVKALDESMGCSGNQHDCARSLARLVFDGREGDAAGLVPAGLSPITGSADYSPVSGEVA